MYATFNGQVSGYGISSCLSDDKSGYVYHIAAWDSIWSGKIVKNDANHVILNPNGEKVAAVYYYETDGSGEILLFGEQQNPCSVIIKQPNLKLLAVFAALLMLICIGALIVYRKNMHAVQITTYCLLFPISYLLSHLLVKGVSFGGYTSAEDFWMILLCMIPIYLIIFIGLYLLKFRKAATS